MNDAIQEGDTLYDTAACEEHTVLEIQEGGYLMIQYSAMKRAELDGGKNIIHSDEVDGVNIKKIASAPQV